MKRIAVCWIFLLGAGWLNAQVVLSRRVYAEHGRTWRQLWIASRGSVDFRQLTHSARDHMEPLCSRDGRFIYFVSDRDGTRSLNAYAGATDRELWAFDRQTGHERPVWQTSDDDGLHLSGTTADGGVLIGVGKELRSVAGHSWHIDRIDPAYNAAAVSPDGRALAIVIAGSLDNEGQSRDAKLFIVDTATGQSRAQVGKCARIAAIADDGLAILDVATRKVPGIEGSGTVQYLRPVATTPLAPGSTHNVWTAQLAVSKEPRP